MLKELIKMLHSSNLEDCIFAIALIRNNQYETDDPVLLGELYNIIKIGVSYTAFVDKTETKYLDWRVREKATQERQILIKRLEKQITDLYTKERYDERRKKQYAEDVIQQG